MASPITQRVKSSYNQAKINKKSEIVYVDKGTPETVKTENESLQGGYTGNKLYEGDYYASDSPLGKEMARMGITDLSKKAIQDYEQSKLIKNRKSGNTGEFAEVQGTNEAGETRTISDADLQNISEEDIANRNLQTETTVAGTDDVETAAYVPDKFKDVVGRAEAGNLKRTKNMQIRDDKRTMGGDYRGLVKDARQSWKSLSRDEKKAIKDSGMSRGEYVRGGGAYQDQGKSEDGGVTFQDSKGSQFFNSLKKSRKSGGGINKVMSRYDVNEDGSMGSGGQNFNVASDGSRMVGTTLQTQGGNMATDANVEYVEGQTGTITQDDRIESNNEQKGKPEAYVKQLNPKSHKLDMVYDHKGNPLGDFKQNSAQIKALDKKGIKYSFTKPGTKLPAVSGSNLPVVQNNSTMSKINKTANNLKNTKSKGKFGTMSKIVGTVAAGVTGYFLGKSSSNNNNNNNTEETNVTPTPTKTTGKSYDQAYQDRDRKTYGHMNKSNYIKEAKRQNDVFAKTGKWDYKNAPKDPGPVSNIKPAKVAPVSTNVKPEANVNLDNIPKPKPSVSTVKPKVSDKKVEKLGNRISRLEGKKSTPRRERKINKLQQKQAGVDKDVIRSNKVIDKNTEKGFNALMEGNNVKAARNLGKVKRHVDKGNPAVVGDIKARENQLKAAAGFKQKGWGGFQK
jgi:hypothetical protein|tara:strand:+ start:1358 stop:3388 length:2031 start_codon:yes stop_codon:yes gene_type:complete